MQLTTSHKAYQNLNYKICLTLVIILKSVFKICAILVNGIKEIRVLEKYPHYKKQPIVPCFTKLLTLKNGFRSTPPPWFRYIIGANKQWKIKML